MMKYNAFFFDLDGTLYDKKCGLLDCVNRRIGEWIRKTVDLPDEEIPALRERLFQKYGGTLPGLTVEYGSDFYASLRYCHDIRVEEYVAPNPELYRILGRLEGRKYLFTSSYRFYAVKVLQMLGILDRFDGIIDAVDVFPTPKPAPEAFRKAFQITAESDISRCVFVDDHTRNVTAGHQEGFFAVQVGNEPRSEFADAYIPVIEDLLTIPEFQS